MRAASLISVVAGAWVAAGCASPGPPTTALQPTMLSANTVRVTTVVEAVDRENRILTLRTQNGDLRSMLVDPGVENFDQIRRGDQVVADYLQQVAVYIDAPGVTTKDESARVSASAARRNKPTGAVVDTVQRRATVLAIDHESRTVTLQGLDGSVRTIAVPSELGPLSRIHTGDPIIIRYTHMVGISVSKATP